MSRTLLVLFLLTVLASNALYSRIASKGLRTKPICMADVEVIFPNNKKVKVPSGSALKEAAKKAGFTPNYGCEEGMSCMHSL